VNKPVLNKPYKYLLLIMLPFLVACQGTIKPWVKPYERNNLTLPVMDWALDPVADNYMHHVYQAREGARGAQGTSGGGCGCN
jgi:Domain of unknown function (DUF4266)